MDFIKDNVGNEDYPPLIDFGKKAVSKVYQRECRSKITISFKGTEDYNSKVFIVVYLHSPPPVLAGGIGLPRKC